MTVSKIQQKQGQQIFQKQRKRSRRKQQQQHEKKQQGRDRHQLDFFITTTTTSTRTTTTTTTRPTSVFINRYYNHKKPTLFCILWVAFLLLPVTTIIIPVVLADKCMGPESPDDLREALWAGSSQLTDSLEYNSRLSAYAPLDSSSPLSSFSASQPKEKRQQQQQQQQQDEQQEMRRRLQPQYQKRTRPGVAMWKESDPHTRGRFQDIEPDKVHVQLHVLSVTEIDQKRGQFQIMAWFRQKWNDHRLQYKTENEFGCFPDDVSYRQGFDLDDLNYIWKPDISIQNQVNLNLVTGSFWVYPNGDVALTRSMLITLSCKFNLARFPKDVQHCSVMVGTWMEDASDIVLDFYDDRDPVTIGDNQYNRDGNHDYANGWGGTSEWDVLSIDSRIEKEQELVTQKETVVYFDFKFERKSKYYSVFVIMPTVLFVFIGWMSFFISRGSAPARVTMTMICFLTNINFLATQLNSLPRSSHTVWLLQFLTMSTIFTFYTVVEYVVCNYFFRIEVRLMEARKKARELKLQKYGSAVRLNVSGRGPEGGGLQRDNTNIKNNNKSGKGNIICYGEEEDSEPEQYDNSEYNKDTHGDDDEHDDDDDDHGASESNSESHSPPVTDLAVAMEHQNKMFYGIRRGSNYVNPDRHRKSSYISHRGSNYSVFPDRRRSSGLTITTANPHHHHNITNPSFSISKPKNIPVNKKDLVAMGYKYKIDLLILNDNGKMIIKDQHLDIFSRVAYPITYLIATLVLVIMVDLEDK